MNGEKSTDFNKKHYYITNPNDMYLYFEIINQVEPSSVVDIGMFLKRIGALARSVKGNSVSSDICLDGIDFMPEIKANVYRTIYNSIENYETFKTMINDKKYDLAVALRTEYFLDVKDQTALLKWLRTHTKYAVISGTLKNWNVESYINNETITVKELHIEKDAYSLLIFSGTEV
jgi:hypothetical protein